MQYETCHHIHPNGTYCGSPSLRDHKYCYYHLDERVRRLRRARALRDNVPYRLEIPSLDNPYAMRTAISEIAQALAAGQLEPLVAGKLLYAIQLAAANNRRIEQMEAAVAKNQPEFDDPQSATTCGWQVTTSRIQEFPDFEKQLGLAPGADLDAETDAARQRPTKRPDIANPNVARLPPGVRPGSPAYRVFREEAYRMLRIQWTIAARPS